MFKFLLIRAMRAIIVNWHYEHVCEFEQKGECECAYDSDDMANAICMHLHISHIDLNLLNLKSWPEPKREKKYMIKR